MQVINYKIRDGTLLGFYHFTKLIFYFFFFNICLFKLTVSPTHRSEIPEGIRQLVGLHVLQLKLQNNIGSRDANFIDVDTIECCT